MLLKLNLYTMYTIFAACGKKKEEYIYKRKKQQKKKEKSVKLKEIT